ncbi:MAG: YkgJ family cysteine cluster protein [Deltaproteobacteria bacterium]|nr:YkgJ family cysteine cluster protein [Deltaproteobacteria bacterium]
MKAFDCKMCGDCCYGEGGIFLEEKEKKRIAQFLNLRTEDFLTRFCEERNGRIYVKTGEDRFCIFYEKGKGCRVHPVKPARCDLWPYYPANVSDRDTWEMAKWACRGINRECSFEEFVRQSETVMQGKDIDHTPTK